MFTSIFYLGMTGVTRMAGHSPEFAAAFEVQNGIRRAKKGNKMYECSPAHRFCREIIPPWRQAVVHAGSTDESHQSPLIIQSTSVEHSMCLLFRCSFAVSLVVVVYFVCEVLCVCL